MEIQKKRVPEFTRESDESLRILVNSCIREVDRIGVRGRSKSCAAKPREQGSHAVTNIKREVSLKITIKKSKRG